MSSGAGREVEIKLRVEEAEAARRLIERAGFHERIPRLFEENSVYDTSSRCLRAAGALLRLRTAGGRARLTFKGPAEPARHKTREEIEVEVGDPAALACLLERLGYEVAFRYEKYRTEFADGEGEAMLDETPAGVFIELEGPAEWIDRAARSLGYGEADYITASYARLHAGTPAGRAGMRDMLFPRLHGR